MMPAILNRHFSKLKERYPEATLAMLPSGAALITVPGMPLPPGWSMGFSAIRFIAPLGYPNAVPDCFWADKELRLKGNRMPQNAKLDNPVPEVNLPGLWYSWHVQPNNWNANRDDLLTYLAVIMARFGELR
ncbi:MAG: E2/UBC family protein [Salinivirgaceae bacterium]|nr:E2/UBC family protein [Salinivirgaceae bacterium]